MEVVYIRAQRKRAKTTPQTFVPPSALLPFEFVLLPAGFVGPSELVLLPTELVGRNELELLPVGLVGRGEFVLSPVEIVSPEKTVLMVVVCPGAPLVSVGVEGSGGFVFVLGPGGFAVLVGSLGPVAPGRDLVLVVPP